VKILAVDFDGTLVRHEYPIIGPPVPYAFDCLRELQDMGVQLVLWTIRSDHGIHGNTLTEAVEFCKSKGVMFWGINHNPDQGSWSSSRKTYAHLYIDDAALGCPLVYPPDGRPYADWAAIRPLVTEWAINGVLPILNLSPNGREN